MKYFFPAVIALVITGSGFLRAQDAPPPKKEYRAEVIRSASGKIVNDAGLASGHFPLKKGMVFDIITGNMSEAILAAAGQRVKVSRSDLRIFEKPPEMAGVPPGAPGAPPEPPAAPFTPGELVVLSAKYTMAGNQPRNVKNKVEKLIPAGEITAPIQILVSDDLSRAVAGQGQIAAVVQTGPNTVSIIEQPKNILTIQFTFNGRVLTKQGLEGTYLTLP